MDQKTCEVCGKIMKSDITYKQNYLNKRKYCSRKCMGIANSRRIFVKCDYCGKDTTTTPALLELNRRHYCSKSCKFLDRQKGYGITTDKYIWIRIGNKQIKLHRYLMEIKLGRKLKADEIVHHIDFNKFNNNIDNLQVVSRSEHNRIHNFLQKDRTDLYTKEEIDMIKSGCNYKEFIRMFPNRHREAFATKKSRLKKTGKL